MAIAAATLGAMAVGTLRPRLAMPATGSTKPSRPATGRLARNFVEPLNQALRLFRNPDKSLTLTTYETMIETDETIGAGLEFIALSAVSLLGDYTHPKRRIQAFVRDQVKRLDTSFYHAIEDILSALGYGFSVLEVCYAEENGKIVLDELVQLLPKTVSFDLDLQKGSPAYGEIKTIWQRKNTAYQVEIPASKCLIYSYNSKGGNPYGRSRLRSIWKTWVYKEALLKAWGLTLERYGSPIGIAKVKSMVDNVTTPDGDEMPRWQWILQQLENLQNESAFVLEQEEELEFLQPANALGKDFEAFQNHCNRMLFRGLLLPSLLWETQEIGSNALGKKHFDIFLSAMGRLLKDVVKLLVERIFKPLIVWNFGPTPDNNYGDFPIKVLQEENLKLWSDMIFAMTDKGYISPKLEDDLNEVRRRFGFRDASPGEIPEPEPGVNQSNPSEGNLDEPSEPTEPTRPTNPGGGEDESNSPAAPSGTKRRTPRRPTKRQGRPPK